MNPPLTSTVRPPTTAPLARCGSWRGCVAYDVLLQRTPPSWLAMLDRGATTIWEEWDGVDEGNPRASLNH